ncbi:unnamed protein product [Nesidiocoris tenuis]|uniref:Odorant receptor n=1 Tax=Nesidiocoris tenuis TaxID=355587 RepID=A0A6H5H1D6_9HEMI|nr:unnamed protein product [Nesidiocoris tenuis]
MSLLVRTIILLGPHFNDSQYFQDQVHCLRMLRGRSTPIDSTNAKLDGNGYDMKSRENRAVFEEYWHVLDIGLIVPNLESKWSSWFFNLRAFLSGVTMALMAGNFLYTCIAHADNLGLMAFSLHMSILGIIGLGVLICSIKDRYRGIRFVHHFVVQMRDHCVYADCEYNKELIKRRGQLKRKLAIFLARLLRTYVRGTAPVPNESGDGFAMTLALPCWSPFDADHSTFGFIVTFAFELGYIAAILIPVSAEYTRMASVHQREVRQYTNARCASTPGGGLPRYTRSGKSRVHPLRVSTPRNIQK